MNVIIGTKPGRAGEILCPPLVAQYRGAHGVTRPTQ